jgi:hypothetical protein
MDFTHVVETCLDFAKANGGTIATYPVGYHKLEVHSRAARTEIAVEQLNSGAWSVQHMQNAAGESASEMGCASTKEGLREHLLRFWAL